MIPARPKRPKRQAPHGTREAEAMHRNNGTWPCGECTSVRHDVETQMVQRYGGMPMPKSVASAFAVLDSKWTWWDDGERLDVIRASTTAARNILHFGQIVNLPDPLARALWHWVTQQPDQMGEEAA